MGSTSDSIYTSIAVDSSNKVHISYIAFFQLKYATNASGSWMTTAVDSGGSSYQYTSIAIDSSDKVHISYRDATNLDLKYASNASGSWMTTAVDSTGDVGYYTSVAIDSSDKVHISYYDSTNFDLKYATNASGSWVKTTVDSTSSVGGYTSIAIDSLGKVHISYYDSTNTNLKYVTNASGSWMTTTVDSTGDVGSYTSIAIDSWDKVHISYFNATNSDLKYATNAPNCSYTFIRCVPTEYATIQSAIDAAQSGDTVRIAQGIYTENLSILKGGTFFIEGGWNHTTNGHSTDPSLTIIDGSSSGRVFNIDPADAALNLTIKDLKIQNGSSGYGGGLYAGSNTGAYPITLMIENNIFTGNQATGAWSDGGAMTIEAQNNNVLVTVRDNEIYGNHADYDSGGILFRANGWSRNLTATVDGNNIHDNTSRFGAGMLFYNDGNLSTQNLTITNNTITNNTVDGCFIQEDDMGGPAYGGGMGFIAINDTTSSVTLTGNTISGNKAVAGAGIYFGVEENSEEGLYGAQINLASSNNSILNNTVPASCASQTNVSNGGGVVINADTNLTSISTFTFNNDTITGSSLYDLILETDNRGAVDIKKLNSGIATTHRYGWRGYDATLCPSTGWWKRPCLLNDIGAFTFDATDPAIDNDGDGYTENQGDCDDTTAAINPGVSETFGNTIDDDCNPATPDTNIAPTANAGGPYAGTEGSSITLNASGSSDPNNNIATYEWDIDNNGTYDYSSSSSSQSHTYAQQGTYTVKLRVTDALGATSETTTTAVISDTSPTAGFTGNPTSGRAPLTVTFTNSSTGNDQPLTYEWDFDNNGTVDSTLSNPSYEYTTEGTYTVK
ncbi:MAG: PKD domain-containing protein, partial [Thermodesulfovibrionia bacterium]|nr:PKD domain-containing protein [Thermodesulfovibrionia bacterium]